MSALQFATPLALWGLLALPVIWWLLRVTPPRAVEQAFPPLRILASLRNSKQTPSRTPWWLLLLRLALAGLLIIAVAHPFTRAGQTLAKNSGPLLLVIDNGWGAAQDWPERQEAALNLLSEAQGRVVLLATTARPAAPQGMGAEDAAKLVRALQPEALADDRARLAPLLQKLEPAPAEVVWLTDGLDQGQGVDFAAALSRLAPSQILDVAAHEAPLALGQPGLTNGALAVPVLRGPEAGPLATVQAVAGDGRILGEAAVEFGAGRMAEGRLALPVELRNAVQALVLKEQRHAGAIRLLDDAWKRKTVAIMSGDAAQGGQPLLSDLHYLASALAGEAEITTPQDSTELKAALDAGLSMLVLSDIGQLGAEDHDAVAAWLDKGGLLVRFSGPKLAASADDLLPVRLREGDRNLGSSLSWETPQTIRPMAAPSPLDGIAVDADAKVSRQLLAEPDVDLAAKTWASLSDGTPLITSARHGAGRIVLFHVTANADWSNLPLTGTFAAILQHLAGMAPAAGNPAAVGASADLAGDFAPHLMLQGTGDLVPPLQDVKPIAAAAIAQASATPQTPAGLYARGTETRAINLRLTAQDLDPLPPAVAVAAFKPQESQPFAPLLFALAAVLFLADSLASLLMGGPVRRGAALSALLFAVLAFGLEPPRARADDTPPPQALETRLAYVKTGDADLDEESRQGLTSLGEKVMDRSSAVLGAPQAVTIESDELVFHPLIYWPVKEDAAAPSAKGLANLNAYLKNGGTVLFDLRDQAAAPGSGPTGEALRRILAKLDVPPLEPVPEGHALRKSFYLLKDFPGRYEGGPLWVEHQDEASTSGFDSVSSIIIGSNDYAAAWAGDENDQPLYALVPGSRNQREMALRVGINLVMYVLTGNYKTDQVHVPAILQRLGKQ